MKKEKAVFENLLQRQEKYSPYSIDWISINGLIRRLHPRIVRKQVFLQLSDYYMKAHQANQELFPFPDQAQHLFEGFPLLNRTSFLYSMMQADHSKLNEHNKKENFANFLNLRHDCKKVAEHCQFCCLKVVLSKWLQPKIDLRKDVVQNIAFSLAVDQDILLTIACEPFSGSIFSQDTFSTRPSFPLSLLSSISVVSDILPPKMEK
mgnify:CR=1 FL=1